MHVHVEQAGQQRALLQVDDAIAGGRRAESGFDRDDLACIDDHGLVASSAVSETPSMTRPAWISVAACARAIRQHRKAAPARSGRTPAQPSADLDQLDVEHQRRARRNHAARRRDRRSPSPAE